LASQLHMRPMGWAVSACGSQVLAPSVEGDSWQPAASALVDVAHLALRHTWTLIRTCSTVWQAYCPSAANPYGKRSEPGHAVHRWQGRGCSGRRRRSTVRTEYPCPIAELDAIQL